MSVSLYTRLFLLILSICVCTTVVAKNDNNEIKLLEQKLQAAKTDTSKANIYVRLAVAYKIDNCNEPKMIVYYLNEAIKLYQKANDATGVYEGYHLLGKYYEHCLLDFNTATTYYQKASTLAEQNDDMSIMYLEYVAIAFCNEKLGNNADAIAIYNNILNMNFGIDTMIQTYGNIGGVYQNMGDYPNALNYYQKGYNLLTQYIISAKKATNADSLTLMGLKYQMANIYMSIPDYNKALEKYNEVQALNKSVGFEWFDALANMGIADCYLQTDEPVSAIIYYKKAEAIIRNYNTNTRDEYLPQVLRKLSDSYYERAMLDSALYYASQTLLLIEGKGGNGQRLDKMPRAYLTIGKIYSAQKKYDKALAYLKRSIELSKKSNANDVQSNALLELSNTYKNMGRVADAFTTYQQHIALKDSIYSRAKLEELTRIDMQGAFDRQQYRDSLQMAKEKALVGYQLQKQRLLTYSGLGGVVLLLLLSFLIFRNYQHQKKAVKIASDANETISIEKQVSENLLLNILPEEVANELKLNGNVVAQLYDPVTVLFTDFVNFTKVGETLTAQELVAELDVCFKAFDEIVDKYDIEKIKTVGDAYLAVSGLPVANANHAVNVVNAAIEIRDFIADRKQKLDNRTFDIRIGINSGSVVAGIVGKKKFAYDIWGDTVNIAARMEQHSEPGHINISEYTHEIIQGKFSCVYRGEIAAKNKGMMKMYFVTS